MFPDTQYRTKIDLSGQWNYTIDGKTWGSISVPSAYDSPERIAFQREFTVTSDMLDAYTFELVAYGIDFQSEITMNGNFIGRHLGGYASFVLSIPQNTLQVGKDNVIRISVDNELTPKTTLPLRQQVGGWRTYGGIFRDLYILATPKLFIESADTKSELISDGKGGVKSARVQVHAGITDRRSAAGPSTGMTGFQLEMDDKLSGEMVGRSGIVQITPQQNKTISLDADVTVTSPKLWSPETPDLYILKCQIVHVENKEVSVIDEFVSDVGLRAIAWKDGRLSINNNPETVKGVVWQEDHTTFGSAMTYESLEHDVASMKALGANTVRFLYPPHPYMLNLCDRYGLLVMEEIPLVNVPAEILMKDYYQEMAFSYLKEMVERDKGHVSVLAWGIGDEFETTGEVSEYVNAARNLVKSLDDRSVYFATHLVQDPCFQYVDLIALNTYGADVKEMRELLRGCRKRYPEKPIIVARYGREVEPGNRNGYSDPLSMESQARYIVQCYDLFKEAKIAGGTIWSFNDWRTDRAALTSHSNDPYLHSTGIVGYDREKRTAYDVVRALFNDEKVQALPVGNYSSSAPIVFVITGFVALISLAFVYNGNRRFRDAVVRSMFRTYNFFADVRDQRILTYSHSLVLAAIVSVTLSTFLASLFSHYRESLLLDNVLSQILSDEMKEWLIRLVWHPMNFILVFSGIVLALLVLLSVLVEACSMMVRTRVYFYHAFSVTMWSMLPCIILIPVSMLAYRLMESDFYVLPIIALTAIILLWVLIRLLKGISIIYDIFAVKVYAIGVLVLILVGAAAYGYLDYTKATTVYLKYMMQSIKNSA